MQASAQTERRAIPHGPFAAWIRISGRLSGIILRYSVVLFLLAFGAQKWTAAEAMGIEPFIRHSPFFSWIFSLFSVQHASDFIGVIELILAFLIAGGRRFPRLCAAGSSGAVVMFLLTLSFLATTPGLGSSDQGFLMKDLTLLGASLWSLNDALGSMQSAHT